MWAGLTDVAVGRFVCSSQAALRNLDSPLSDNLRVAGNIVSYSDENQRFFRTVFKLASGDNVSFTWPVPGVFLALEETKSGQPVERMLSKGDILQVRAGSRQRLKIYSSSEGTLRLGEFSRVLPSALLGGTQIHLAGLVEYLSPEHQTLRLEFNDERFAHDLVTLVAPHQVIRFESRREGDKYLLVYTVAGRLDAISIRAENIQTGATKDVQVGVDVDPAIEDFRRAVTLSTITLERLTSATMQFQMLEWDDGAWVFHLLARIDGRWGQLVNARGDVYAGSFRNPPGLRLIEQIDGESTDQSLDIFERLNDVAL
jgi:hypothetical protein